MLFLIRFEIRYSLVCSDMYIVNTLANSHIDNQWLPASMKHTPIAHFLFLLVFVNQKSSETQPSHNGSWHAHMDYDPIVMEEITIWNKFMNENTIDCRYVVVLRDKMLHRVQSR